MKMASSFGGGFGRWGTVCGAVVGGAMAIGYRFGRTQVEDKESREKTYSKIQEMIREFEKANGSIICKDLIHLNLLDPAERKKFAELKLQSRCGQFVAANIEKIRRLLEEK